MVISRQQATVIAGTASIFLLHLIGSSNMSLAQKLKGTGIYFAPPEQALPNPAAANKGIEFKPPNRGAPSITGAGGARFSDWPPTDGLRGIPASCSPSLMVSLVPQNHSGITTSSNPSFFWYVSDDLASENQTRKMEFSLQEVGKTQPVFTAQIPVEKNPGIIQIQLPKDKVALVEGKDYLWSVSVPCVSNGETKKMVIQAAIRRVSATPELTRLLNSASSGSARASAYAQQGFWYDALDTLSKASEEKPEDRSVYDDFYALLDQVGLNQVTAKLRQ